MPDATDRRILRQLLADPDIANPDLADAVEVEETYRIYRDTGAVVTEAGRQDPDARAFLDFLKSEEGAAIFGRWGWRTDAP